MISLGIIYIHKRLLGSLLIGSARYLQCFTIQYIKTEQNEFIGNGELGVGEGLSY